MQGLQGYLEILKIPPAPAQKKLQKCYRYPRARMSYGYPRPNKILKMLQTSTGTGTQAKKKLKLHTAKPHKCYTNVCGRPMPMYVNSSMHISMQFHESGC